MKVVCTIGSQGLSDGRRFVRGDVYEVDDEIASALILNGYAEERVIEEVVTDDNAEPERVVEDVVDAVVDEVVDDNAVTKTSDKPKKTKNKGR